MIKRYAIVSGEGDNGTWEATGALTDGGIKRRLKKERCGGDRWAHAYADIIETDWGYAGTDIETGEQRDIPDDIAEDILQ